YVEDHLLVAEAVSQVPRPEWIADVHALLDHFRALPGVKDAGFSHAGQLSGFGINGTVSVPGSVALSETALDPLEHRVSPRFLTTMGARFLAGRDIADTDDEGGQRV